MSSENLLNPETLHRALEGSLSPDQAARKQSEEYLLQVSTLKGAIPLLLSLISAEQVVDTVRLAGAIKLKNLVLSQWRDDKTICAEDRAALWNNLYDAVLSVGPNNDAIRRQCFEILRHIVFNAQQGDTSSLIQRVRTDIEQRSNGDRLICALKVIRKLMYRYEYHTKSLTQEVNAIVDVFFDQLLKVAQDASAAGLDAPEAAACIHQVLKVYFSMGLLTSPTTDTVEKTIQAWMALVRFVLDSPVSWNAVAAPGTHPMLPYVELPDEEEARLHAMPRFKCFKWALHILTKYMSRQVPRKENKEEGKRHYTRFIKDGYAEEFAKKLLVLMQAEATGSVVLTNHIHHKIWTYLKYAVAFPAIYNTAIKPCAAVIVQMLFQTFACNVNDEQMYSEDPESYIQSCADVSFQLLSPRGTAADFIKDACKLRRPDFVPIVISAARDVFSDRESPVSVVYGVMCLIGHAANSVLQNTKKVNKKRVSNQVELSEEQLLNGEAFLVGYVLPLLGSTDKWLRMRSAWLCGRVVMTISVWRDSQTLLKIYSRLVELLNDEEVIVSVMATSAVLSFFHNSDETLQKTIVEYLPHLLQSLFKLMERIELETVVSTLDEIVDKYSVAVLPFGAQITENVCNALWSSISSEGALAKDADYTSNDEQVLARWSMVQTLTSIVRLAADADTENMTAGDCEMFAKITKKTNELLIYLYEALDIDRLMDFLDDLAYILSYLAKIANKVVTFAGEEKAAAMGVRFDDLWRIMGLCMKAVAGYHDVDSAEEGELPAIMVELSVLRDPVRSLLAHAPNGFTFEIAVQLYTLCQRASIGDDARHSERLLADVFEICIKNRACDRILQPAAQELTRSVVTHFEAITETPSYYKSKIRYVAIILIYSCGENPPLKSLESADTLIKVIMNVSPGERSKYMRKLYMMCLTSLMQIGIRMCDGKMLSDTVDQLLLEESGGLDGGNMYPEIDELDDEEFESDSVDYDYCSDEDDDDDDDYEDDEDYDDDDFDEEYFDDGCSPLDENAVSEMKRMIMEGKFSK
ncbi:Importin beta-like SAD2 -like protein [Babesia sp. Xinjiang]|uniref:Importin beta-like SAD2 -like protein n=1 Tax=Babesia sp. Xinjiang TaxID=462227 RepID=UPI000A24E6FA|nr:Importin beta-like SAD2 -like protein [Babesia sp. Xinjiang]ORM42359.1 Importin beta-like SAD2 -like protein [Babesia sp. Xinjiang]